MMEQEMIICIKPSDCSITVEETSKGVVSYKQISIDSLYDCIKGSLKKESVSSGLLPQNCISFVGGDEGYRSVSVILTDNYADISYYKTVYEHFPLPRLVFNFKLNMGLRINSCSVGVVHDERLTPDSLMYKYPFSNVSGYKLCTGNNTLPTCESLHTLSSLPHFILNLPNNDDMYEKRNNRQMLEYRDLLEHLKDKTPSYYYENVLVLNGHTLKDFFKY